MPAGIARWRFFGSAALNPIAPILPSPPHGDHHGELVVDVDDLIALGHQSRRDVEAAQVDDGKPLQAKVAEIVLHAGSNLLGTLRRLDGKLRAWIRVGTDLGRDHDPSPIGKNPADDIVGEAVSVKLGRIDVIDAQVDRPRKQGESVCGPIGQTLKLHGAEANPGYIVRAQGRGAGINAGYFWIVGHRRIPMLRGLIGGPSV